MSEDFDVIDFLSTSNVDLLSAFYKLLWKKSNGGRETQHCLTNIVIPDTVILHHSRPLHWYFTSKMDGTILMKSRKSLTTNNIKEHFKKKMKSVSGCAVQVIRSDKNYETTFHSKSELDAALADGISGVLQQFLDPKGADNNVTVTANWTPNVFFLERCANQHKLSSGGSYGGESSSSSTIPSTKRLPLQERCTTSETSGLVAMSAVVSSHVVRCLENTCQEIATHINTVFKAWISNMVLHFKLIEDDVPVLLYCSSLKLSDAKDRLRVVNLKLNAATTVSTTGGGSNGNSTASSPVRGSGTRHGELPPLSPSPTRQVTYGDAASPSTSPSPSHSHSSSRRRRSKYSKSTRSSSSLSNLHVADDDIVTCRLCSARHLAEASLPIATKHALFPLSVLSFYSTRPQSDVFYDVWDENEEDVPRHVLLLFPEMTSSEYSCLRTDERWLNTSLPFCSNCSSGVMLVVSSIDTKSDGTIQYPFGKSQQSGSNNASLIRAFMQVFSSPPQQSSDETPRRNHNDDIDDGEDHVISGAPFSEAPTAASRKRRATLRDALGQSTKGTGDDDGDDDVSPRRSSSLPPIA